MILEQGKAEVQTLEFFQNLTEAVFKSKEVRIPLVEIPALLGAKTAYEGHSRFAQYAQYKSFLERLKDEEDIVSIG